MSSSAPLLMLSSMAAREVLKALATDYTKAGGAPVDARAAGGVDVAKRVRAGEAVDVVVLASNVIDELIAEGHLTGARVDLTRSGVGIAVPSGRAHPPVATEADVREAVLAARTLSFSTGPSGTYLQKLFERWGILSTVKDRISIPPPGVPVGSFVAEGRADLGFQQLSELINVAGIDVLGPLPAGHPDDDGVLRRRGESERGSRRGACVARLDDGAVDERREAALRHGADDMSETFGPLITTAWLAEHLEDAELRILDCTMRLVPFEGRVRPENARDAWAQGHIPGSGYVDLLGELSDKSSPLPLMMPSPAQFADVMGSLGIDRQSRVVLYDAANHAWATRVWWMFRAVGFDRAAVLDGGFARWKAEGRAISTQPPRHAPSQFVAFRAPGCIRRPTRRAGRAVAAGLAAGQRARCRRARGAGEPCRPSRPHPGQRQCTRGIAVRTTAGRLPAARSAARAVRALRRARVAARHRLLRRWHLGDGRCVLPAAPRCARRRRVRRFARRMERRSDPSTRNRLRHPWPSTIFRIA